MAHPFPNTFDKDSPMSPQSAISYQTNVNRRKTKKWAEAKPVDYGGGWGDDDDDEYDPPPPPPISKPTGLRQQGQGLSSTSKVESPALDSRKYGDLPPLPGASNPRPRANSFDADDEKRDFSSSTHQPPPLPATNAPATRFSQITGVPTVRKPSGPQGGPPTLSISTQQPPQAPVGLRKPSQVISPVAESPHPEILLPGPGRVNTGESSVISPVSDTRTPSTASDYHARRDFSPSAVPPPLSTRASPAPQSAADGAPSQRFPPRRSSLSQSTAPPLTDIMQSPAEDATPKPWVGARSDSPGATARSPTSPTSGKALPFIRPADIYRRAEEERRQSIESAGRPSMDSIMGSKASERSNSPAKSHVGERSSSDSLGGTGRRRTSFDNEDASDSGRRLMPMLEPVKERKSEYGFEGFNVNDHAPQGHSQERSALENRNLDVEEARRQSTSPKLPDLTRMSGFGMDIFAPKDTESINKEAETTPTTTSLSSPEQDLTLRNQPSFGFKSVVHQAFDTTDDQSIPNTPASRSGSGVRRTDSESTGTAGISPIMSRVSSTAVPETRNRDISTPAIMEATEPASPETASAIGDSRDGLPAQAVPGFKPGHRRDISAPSPGNSPARTPDLATSHFAAGGQYAVVDDTPPDVASPVDDVPLDAPRPIAEREHSFRPSLPGGWTSYATTARSETPTQAVETPAAEASSVQEQRDEDDHDLTPTTTKRSLPQTALGAAIAGATFSGAALGRHDTSSPSTPVPEDPRSLSGRSTLVSPDSHSQIPDLRLLPKLEQAPSETQLRPDVVDRPVSTMSTPPPPPTKDSPDVPEAQSLSERSDYLSKPAVPLDQRSQDDTGSEERLQPTMRPDIPPTLSKETREYDEENDKLRNEIVESLSPRPSSATAHDDSMPSDPLDDTSLSNQNRESSYLPREYDNYWASTDQDEDVPAVPEAPRDIQVPSEAPAAQTDNSSHSELEVVPAPLSPRRLPEGSLQPPRPTLQSRFSWEQSSENVSVAANRDEGYLATDSQRRSLVANEMPGSVAPVEEEKQVANESPEYNPSSEQNLARDTAVVGGAAALGGAAAASYLDRPEEKSRRLSLAEEKDPRVSSNPVSPTPPEDEHPSRSPHQYFPTSPEFSLHPPAPPSTVSPVTSPVLPSAPLATGRLLAFREIVAMKSPEERIKTFDETRQRFAAMDSGLNDWIFQLQTQFPEEHGAGSSWGGARTSMPSGSARSKFSKSTGGVAPPLQQPYYQQYLNASSPPTPSTPVSGGPRPSPSIPIGSQQGFSSSSTSKITSQQVQAKGKEFLHTAGIFGGKAGKAGKGLLAKGKNKLHAARGGDKTSPDSKPKPDRRSSWGLPLALSRSPGRPDAISRHSRDSTPASPLSRPRTNTMQSDRGSPAPQLPAVATGYSLGVMSGALHSEHPEQAQPSTIISPAQQPKTAVEEYEARDTLGVPAPIGKNQPSWDPFNATPIAEEDGFQYEDGSKPRVLSGPANPGKNDQSNSSDVPFVDAPEDSSELPNDWVMVSPEHESKTLVPGEEPPVNHESNVEPAVKQSIDKSATSILDCPRGSFSNDRSLPSPARPTAESEVRQSLDNAPATSILNRPRGSFSYELSPSSPGKSMTSPLAIVPAQPTQTAARPATPPAPIAAPVQAIPSPPEPTQMPVREQSSSSSFLPPIRRTSTFGLGFGSTQSKPGFPIEKNEEASPPQQQTISEHRTAPEGVPEQQPQQQQTTSGHTSAVFGAAAGAAALAGAGIADHQRREDMPQGIHAEDARSVSPQRPLSFEQTRPREIAATFTAEPEDLGPPDDTNTWGILNSESVPPFPTAPVPLMGTSEPERQVSFPPPGFAVDPKGHAPALTTEHEDLGPPDDTNTWGVQDSVPPLPTTPLPSQPQRKLSFPPPGFNVDAEAHAFPPADTNTWGVRDESQQHIAQAILLQGPGRQRETSFPPPGFAVDPQAHGPSQVIRPVDVAPRRTSPVKEIPPQDSGAQSPLSFQQTPERVSVPQSELSRTPPGFTSESQEASQLGNIGKEPPPPADTSASSFAPPRPLSFQQTPPKDYGSRAQPSSVPELTREPEGQSPPDDTNTWGERELAAPIPKTRSLRRVDSQRSLRGPPPGFTEDPEKTGPIPPQQIAAERSSINHTPSLEQNEHNRTSHREPPRSMFTPPRAAEILQRPEFKESQVEWRPNRPRVITKPTQSSSFSSESYSKEIGAPAARVNSWDTQPPPRGYSGSSSFIQRQDSQFTEKGGWTSPQQSKPFEQPPSSAQRYPDLFRPGQQTVIESPRDASKEVDRDLPAHLYQAPIPRAQAFLPRQQTSEYQLPGVGPPENIPSNPPRRNSGFFSGRLSRTSSRERRNSVSRDRLSPERGIESRDEYAESSVMSEDGQERQKRRSSFFGHLSRNSYSGNSPPKSRESVIAHHAGSRTDLLATPQPSPVKRSFFGGSSSEQKSKPNKLIRQSTTGTMDSPAKKKEKNRFSALGGLFGKPSSSLKSTVQERPQATRELSYNERQPIESPQQDQHTASKYQVPAQHARAESQSRRNVLSKFTSSVAAPQESSRQGSKSRRPSGAGLLSGFMGRKSFQKERGSDDSRSQGSQPQVGPQPILSQTYTDLQEQEPQPQEQQQQRQQQPYPLQQESRGPPAQAREIPFQDPSLITQDRGRRVSREPQYDSVPIPGGYSLVRGQGAMAVPTEYDPRGLNRMPQIDPRQSLAGSRLSYQNTPSLGQGYQQQYPQGPQQYVNGSQYGPPEQQQQQGPRTPQPPQLGALETYRDYNQASHRISREDILARSPPKHLQDQQRPYQISLPGGEVDDDQDDEPQPTSSRHPSTQHHTAKPKLDTIQRLQQPVLRHPESPAGYPLPEDTVFSPINPSATDLPPPPPPKWPSHLDAQHLGPQQGHGAGHDRHVSLSTMDIDLDRSNTRRTAVSAISGISAPRPISGGGGGLNVPANAGGDEKNRRDSRGVSPSPTPPSPMERGGSLDGAGGEGIRRTEVEVRGRESMEDLYDASPRLPRSGDGMRLPANDHSNGHTNGSPHAPSFGKVNSRSGAGGQLELPRERERSVGNGKVQHQEEKIYYDNRSSSGQRHGHGAVGQEGGPAELEDHETAMSATSYPGQEWNPYGAGAWDDGFD